MSKEELKAFLEKVKCDTSLQDRLKAAKSQDEVVSIAKEHGHDFGTEHISQLSAEELEGVAGGGFTCAPQLTYCGGGKDLATSCTTTTTWPSLRRLHSAKAYTLKASALTGAFSFFNDFHIRLKRHPIPGTIARI